MLVGFLGMYACMTVLFVHPSSWYVCVFFLRISWAQRETGQVVDVTSRLHMQNAVCHGFLVYFYKLHLLQDYLTLHISKTLLGGGPFLENLVFIFTRILGENEPNPIWRAHIFQMGLVQPPRPRWADRSWSLLWMPWQNVGGRQRTVGCLTICEGGVILWN